ncbi:MAG: peptidoglycan DD-metalloendopeptidase family protein [Pseudomonadales bacterium]
MKTISYPDCPNPELHAPAHPDVPARALGRLLLVLALCCGAPSATAADSGEGTAAVAPVPGGLYLFDVPEGTREVRYQGHPVLVLDGQAIVGIPVSAAPGAHSVRLVDSQGAASERRFEVKAKAYPEQHLTIANPKMVNPDPADLTRIRNEAEQMRVQYLRFTDPVGDLRPFRKPLEGITTSQFGFRRVLNGEPRSPHSGLDIDSPKGAPIAAPAAGIVALTGNFYFNGNTVFLDHGHGLITMYCHMSEIRVEPGARVARGDVIGLVGATGRVTGPHLHWSVSMNGNRVDPVQVMAALAVPAAAGSAGD